MASAVSKTAKGNLTNCVFSFISSVVYGTVYQHSV
jgi:hypothetical protein